MEVLAMEPVFSRSVVTVGDRQIATLRGELDLVTAEGLVEWLTGIAGSTLIVDLSELTFMSSSGITVMLQAKRQLGDGFVLTRPQPNVRRVFELTGLGDMFTEWDPSWTVEP